MLDDVYRRIESHYGCQELKERLRAGSLPPNGPARLGRAPQEWDRLPNNSMQRTALRAAADAERYATFWMVFDKRHVTQYS